MKKLIVVTVLGLSLGFSALSFASDYMDLYTSGPAKHEVKSGVKGGEVETSPMSFYLGDHNVRVTETLRNAEKGASDECSSLD